MTDQVLWYDDYRPKPEVSTPTPESESPDPIESEILDSVPKTMRGKAELLLKNMKTNRDITWNVRLVLFGISGVSYLVGDGLSCRLRLLSVLLA
jgi:hypothetical protein